MIQFYAPDIEQTHELPEGESAHCCRVLRLKEGDVISVTDGKGAIFKCEIILSHPKHTGIRILEKTETAPLRRHHVTLAVAPTKNIDRIEWLIEKAVEVGVDRIALVKCARSERKNINTGRLERIIVSAMNQSLKANLPVFEGLVPLSEFLEKESSEARDRDLFMGYCSEEVERRSLSGNVEAGRDVTLLIGPEGDFSPEEVEAALAHGFMPVTFGEMRLRTETAALYGLQTVHIINELA